MKKQLVKRFKFAGLKFKKHSPEILIVAGVIGTVASAVMACKATLKVNDILDDAKEDVDVIHAKMDNKVLADRYSQEDGRKDLAIVYVQTGVKFVKLYAPSVILGGLSLTCMVASNNILRKRNVALAAAYSAVNKGFKEYRGRVIDRFGKEIDRELRCNIKAKEIEETVVDENGQEKKVTSSVNEAMVSAGEFTRIFDESNPNWVKDSDHNQIFLKMAQRCANDKLIANGYLFLNDVFDSLGFERTKAGQIVGWVYRPDDPNHIGDNYVDFGIYDAASQSKRMFVNGNERSIWLDFNVDGDILSTF